MCKCTSQSTEYVTQSMVWGVSPYRVQKGIYKLYIGIYNIYKLYIIVYI